MVPPLDERDFEKTVTPIVQEYFEHGDTNEVAVSAPALCRKHRIVHMLLCHRITNLHINEML